MYKIKKKDNMLVGLLTVNPVLKGTCICGVRVMVFNATVNNISAISWRPVLVVEEAGVP